MKIEQKDDFNPKRQRRLRAAIFTLILIGAMFVSTVGNVGDPIFQPPHSDYGEDTDGDGLFNYLIVNVIIYVDAPGNYILYGSLEDSLGFGIDSDTNSTFLNTGIQVVQLRFEGWLIRQNGVSGPYTVYLDLYDSSWNPLGSDIHITDAYNYNKFEHPPAEFSPPPSDYGLDTDGDGYFNYLVVNVSIEVSVAGFYWLYGDLFDGLSHWIADDTNYTFLDVGTQVVQLYFNGTKIHNNGVDGPYTVYLDLDDDSFNWVGSDTYTTNFYTYEKFQPPSASFKPPHSDYGLDTDGDGYFNYLVVNVTVNVSVAGSYKLEGDLFDTSYKLLDDDSNLTFLDVGIQIIQLRFNGVSIYNNGVDGTFIAELDLYGNLTIKLDSDAYTTNFYPYDKFQPPCATFGPSHSDYGLDTDGDGYFNYLVVNVTVNVSVAGNYNVKSTLVDSFFSLIEFVDNFTFLNPGIQVVQLFFTGSAIYNNFENGPYLVFLELLDDSLNLLDKDIYNTGGYTFNQFQPPAIPPPPTGLQASLINVGNDVILSWNASVDDGKGEKDVAGYTVYKSITGIDGIYDFVAWINATGSPSYNWIDLNAGDGDWNDYFYMVRANDTLDIEEQNANKVGKVVIYLQDGWNLISLPLIQTDTSKEYVLQTIEGNYLTIQRYHAGKSRPWLHWHKGKPAHLNDLMNINPQDGYYVDMQIPDHLVLAGKVPPNKQISLKTGWNLVSYPSLLNKTVSDALSSIAGKYNKVEFYNTNKDREVGLEPTDHMQSCLGYWIHATENCVWDI